MPSLFMPSVTDSSHGDIPANAKAWIWKDIKNNFINKYKSVYTSKRILFTARNAI